MDTFIKSSKIVANLGISVSINQASSFLCTEQIEYNTTSRIQTYHHFYLSLYSLIFVSFTVKTHFEGGLQEL